MNLTPIEAAIVKKVALIPGKLENRAIRIRPPT
jgi:hypothetical protein